MRLNTLTAITIEDKRFLNDNRFLIVADFDNRTCILKTIVEFFAGYAYRCCASGAAYDREKL